MATITVAEFQQRQQAPAARTDAAAPAQVPDPSDTGQAPVHPGAATAHPTALAVTSLRAPVPSHKALLAASCFRDALLPALDALHKVADPKSAMPILAHVRLRAEPGKLTLACTDLNRSAYTEVPAACGKAGATTVPAADLLRYLRVVPPGAEVQISAEPMAGADAKNPIHLVTLSALGGPQRLLYGRPGSDFPRLPGEGQTGVDMLRPVEPQLLHTLLHTVEPSISRDETRYHLNGACIESLGTAMRGVSTDGHRMTVCELPLRAPLPRTQDKLLLPLSAVKVLLPALKKARACFVGWEKGHLLVQVDQVAYSFKLNEAQFPPYEQVIPRDTNQRATVNRERWMRALVAGGLAASDKTHGVDLLFANGCLRVLADDPDRGQSQDDIACDFSGEGERFAIQCSARYLLDCLKRIAAEEVTVQFCEELTPILLVEGGITYVVMPMRSEAARCRDDKWPLAAPPAWELPARGPRRALPAGPVAPGPSPIKPAASPSGAPAAAGAAQRRGWRGPSVKDPTTVYRYAAAGTEAATAPVYGLVMSGTGADLVLIAPRPGEPGRLFTVPAGQDIVPVPHVHPRDLVALNAGTMKEPVAPMPEPGPPLQPPAVTVQVDVQPRAPQSADAEPPVQDDREADAGGDPENDAAYGEDATEQREDEQDSEEGEHDEAASAVEHGDADTEVEQDGEEGTDAEEEDGEGEQDSENGDEEAEDYTDGEDGTKGERDGEDPQDSEHDANESAQDEPAEGEHSEDHGPRNPSEPDALPLCEKIAAALVTWDPERQWIARRAAGHGGHDADLVAGELCIVASLNSYRQKGRLVLWGAYGSGDLSLAQFLPGKDRQVDRVTCDPARDPADIAKDLVRRMLSGYLHNRESAQKARDQHVAAENRRKAALTLVADAMGYPPPDQGAGPLATVSGCLRVRDSWQPGAPHGEATAYSDGTVTLKLSSIEPEVAVRCIRVAAAGLSAADESVPKEAAQREQEVRLDGAEQALREREARAAAAQNELALVKNLRAANEQLQRRNERLEHRLAAALETLQSDEVPTQVEQPAPAGPSPVARHLRSVPSESAPYGRFLVVYRMLPSGVRWTPPKDPEPDVIVPPSAHREGKWHCWHSGCSERRGDEAQLRRHYAAQHLLEVPEESRQSLACWAPGCPRVADSEMQLRNHFLAFHVARTGDARHCSLCTREFDSVRQQTKHLLSHPEVEVVRPHEPAQRAG